MADKATTLAEAFLAAQSAMDDPKKTANNPAYKSKYADLNEVLACVKPVLNAHGIALIQAPVSDEHGVGVHTILAGYGEQHDLGTFTMHPAKNDPQGAGGCVTYARRYTLAAICGLGAEDDDGNAASGVKAKPKAEQAVSDTAFLRKKAYAKRKGLDISDAAFKARLTELYGVDDDRKLDESQLNDLIERLHACETANSAQDTSWRTHWPNPDELGGTELPEDEAPW